MRELSGKELSGKVALVTGSTRGIGRAVAERFVAEGAIVVIHGRSAPEAERVAVELGAAGGFGADLAIEASPAELVAAAAAVGGGRLDVLVNNAGAAIDNYLTGVTAERWNQAQQINLTGPFFALQSAVRLMKAQGGGSIVNVISWAGMRGAIGQVAYSAAKAGLIGVTKAAAKELAPFGIRVNALSPVVETDMVGQITDEQRAEAIARVPLGRFGTFAEMAEGALWLASQRSSFTTGQILNIDGGMHLH